MSVQIHREGERFWVPHFEVKIEGRNLPQDLVRDVVDVTYRDKVDEIDSFELTVNNWDASARKFKYEPPSSPAYRELFDPGRELVLSMGYFGNAREMIRGRITTLEPSYPESGSPTLSVRGLNVLHSFRLKQHTWSWTNARDSDIAEEIGRLPRSDDRPGLGFRVKPDSTARGEEPRLPNVFMNNQYDIVFLLDRARRRGYTVFLATDEEGEYLHFGPQPRARRVEYELEWGASLTQFRPTLTTANQVSKVTVRGWDRSTRRAVEFTAELGRDVPIDGDLHSSGVARAIEGVEVITDPPARSREEARRRAIERLRDGRQGMVTATGATVGLPDLRASNKVNVVLGGSRLEGVYFVTGTTHQINANGYRTTFEARRDEPQPNG
jgi:uncharacterized protein